MVRSSSRNWTRVTPRSSVALTLSVVAPFAVSEAAAAGAVQATVGGRSSNGPPGEACDCSSSQDGATVSSVSASTVSVPPLQTT